MAGKPDLSVAQQQQQQPPGVQNVVVYVSNDNFAQAYTVNQQNVAAFTSQGSATPISQQQQQNGGGGGSMAYAAGGVPSMATMAAKNILSKSLVKPVEFQTNTVLENGAAVATAQGNFYTSNVITQNGFPQSCANTNIVNNITAYHNNLNHLNSVPVLSTNSFDSAVKNVIDP